MTDVSLSLGELCRARFRPELAGRDVRDLCGIIMFLGPVVGVRVHAADRALDLLPGLLDDPAELEELLERVQEMATTYPRGLTCVVFAESWSVQTFAIAAAAQQAVLQ